MFKTLTSQIIKNEIRRRFPLRFSTAPTKTATDLPETTNQKAYQVLDTRSLPSADFVDATDEKLSVLEECKEDISHVAPYLQPTFNFAAYVNKSETLQQLVKLGVNLHKIEKTVDAVPFILKLDFERDVKGHIRFLHDHGVSLEDVANILTRNPLVLKERLEDLDVRINYLESKRFDREMISRVLSCNPFWLSFSTQQIDERLGFFQTNFNLTGQEVRQLAVQLPKVITGDLEIVKLNKFVLKEEMGFTDEEMKQMIVKKPKILLKSQRHMLKTFEYVHKTMGIPLETIVNIPEVLTCRQFRIKQRYLFLKSLNKLQFDPKKPLYISLRDLIAGSDAHFSTEVAKSSIQAFNAFLKTL